MIRGIIFDMDGVLVDTKDFHIAALQQLGKEKGRELSEEFLIEILGWRNEEALVEILGHPLTDEELFHYQEHKEALYRKLIKPHLTPVTGLLELLEDLKQNDFRIALATNGYRKNIDFILDGLNIRRYFSATIGSEDVSRGKPYPDPFVTASHKLSLEPEQCIVFEDSDTGIQAAKSAGCLCIALTTTLPHHKIDTLQPYKIIKDFTEISVKQIKEIKQED